MLQDLSSAPELPCALLRRAALLTKLSSAQAASSVLYVMGADDLQVVLGWETLRCDAVVLHQVLRMTSPVSKGYIRHEGMQVMFMWLDSATVHHACSHALEYDGACLACPCHLHVNEPPYSYHARERCTHAGKVEPRTEENSHPPS